MKRTLLSCLGFICIWNAGIFSYVGISQHKSLMVIGAVVLGVMGDILHDWNHMIRN